MDQNGQNIEFAMSIKSRKWIENIPNLPLDVSDTPINFSKTF